MKLGRWGRRGVTEFVAHAYSLFDGFGNGHLGCALIGCRAEILRAEAAGKYASIAMGIYIGCSQVSTKDTLRVNIE